MNLGKPTLQGRVVRLEPLEARHLPALHRLLSPQTFEHFADAPRTLSLEDFSHWALAHRDGPGRITFAVVLVESGEAVGATSYLDIRPRDRALEIGATWYGAAHQGTQVNPEAKLLLLEHAFEAQGARRVQLKTSSENHRSQRAIARLGAVREGVLRNYQLRPNGMPRDTVMFSLTDAEWPRIRARLERRLGQGGREALRALLDAHPASDEKERADLQQMREHLGALAEPFSRGEPAAHFTGSAVVVSPDGQRVCLVHHGKLHRWLQPGGHADPADEGSMALTALREAAEETGLRVRLHPSSWRPVDVDLHTIPARRDDPEHHHLDVRYLVVADDPRALRHDPAESHGARWLSWDEALALAPPGDLALRRLLEKARARVG